MNWPAPAPLRLPPLAGCGYNGFFGAAWGNMSENAEVSRRRFQAAIYRDLDRRLRESRWNSGASEAHGLLSGLACSGVRDDQLRGKAWLLQLSEKADLELLEGLYGLILRDLQSEGFAFTLLLADEAGVAQKIESLADWCGGFLQGFLHDGEARLQRAPAPVRESLDDILTISRVDADPGAGEAAERQLVEIEEYLRVATQVIFEELNPKQVRTAPIPDDLKEMIDAE